MAAPLSLKAVAQALDRVQSVGQAQAAARAGLAEYDALHPKVTEFLQFTANPFEGFSWKGLDRAVKRVRDAASNLQGAPGVRVRYKRPDGGPGRSEPSWAALHDALLALYNEVYAAQLFAPGYVGWRDGPGILWTSITEAPGVFVRGAKAVARGVGEVAAGAAGAGGSILWAILKPLLPIVGVVVGGAVVVGVAFFALRGKAAA